MQEQQRGFPRKRQFNRRDESSTRTSSKLDAALPVVLGAALPYYEAAWPSVSPALQPQRLPVHTPRLISSLWVVGALSAALATTALRQPTPPVVASTAALLADSISDRADAGRIRGNPAATLWVIEAGDFQCPVCKAWHDQYFARTYQNNT